MEKRPRSIRVLGWVVGVLYLLRAVGQLFPYRLVEEMIISATAPATQIVLALMTLGANLGTQAFVLLSVILFSVWSYQAHENARLLAPDATLSNGPGVMIWSYLIPVVNLFLPYSAMKEVFSVSDLAAQAAEDDDYSRASSGGALLLAWWIMYILSSIIVTFTIRSGASSSSEELTVISVQAPFVLVSAALNFAWCIYLSRLQDLAIVRQARRAP